MAADAQQSASEVEQTTQRLRGADTWLRPHLFRLFVTQSWLKRVSAGHCPTC